MASSNEPTGRPPAAAQSPALPTGRPRSAGAPSPPGLRREFWPAQPTADELAASVDAVLREARGRSTVLTALPCRRRGCGKTLGWVIVLHDERDDGQLRLELAAPVDGAAVDADDRPGTWVAYTLTGKVQTREARSSYVSLHGPELIRITCRCGTRNWLRPSALRKLGEALRL